MNRPLEPRNPAGGWQATPGHPIPRAARQPAANGLLLVMVVLVWFSPLSIVAWLVGQAVILLQRRWHWWRFALAALVAIAAVLLVVGLTVLYFVARLVRRGWRRWKKRREPTLTPGQPAA